MSAHKSRRASKSQYFLSAGLSLLTALSSHAAAQAVKTSPSQDIDAIVNIESRQVGADGVTRSSQLSERFIRRTNTVWTKRLIPPQAPRHAAHLGTPHKHFDPTEAERLLTLEGVQVGLQYALPDEKIVVNVPAPEYANVGFDGSWERAYFFITPQELSKMGRSSKPSQVAGAQWYEPKTSAGIEQVLWDHKRFIPRVIETKSTSGSHWQRVTVTLSAQLGSTLPWRDYQKFDQKRYSDFMD